MRIVKTCIATIFCLVLVMSLFSSCKSAVAVADTQYNPGNTSVVGFNDVTFLKEGSVTQEIADPKYIKSATSEKYTLFYNENDGGIKITNSEDSNEFSTNGLIQFKNEKLNDIWRYNLNAIINISYFMKDKNQGIATETTPAKENAKMKIEGTSTGFSVIYIFETLGFTIRINISLENNVMTFSLPKDGINENKDARLTAIKVLPFFGSIVDGGYMLLPDGSGMIVDCSEASLAESTNANSLYKFDVYGNPIPTQKELDTLSATTMLPVFGVNAGKSAFLAAITNGEAESYIEYAPSGYAVKTHRVAPVFVYRQAVDMTSIAGESVGTKEGQKQTALRFEAAFAAKDVEVKYFLLDGEDSDYSGMARVYRKFLLENKLIKNNELSENYEPYVDLFFGIYEKRILSDKFIEMTSFEEAEQILLSLNEKGVNDVNSTFWGVLDGGYRKFPSKDKLESKLGSKNAFKKLIETAKQTDTRVNIQVDPLSLFSDVKGFSRRGDTVFTLSNIPFLDSTKNMYFRNIKSQFVDYIPKMTKLASEFETGITLENVGDMLLADSSTNSIKSRQESSQYIQDELEKTSQSSVLALGGNGYTLTSTSRITNAPITSSGYDIEDRVVPFYQMVVHGLIPYTSSPYNLSNDFDRTVLKWVEYGFNPYFLICKNNSKDLKFTEASWLYTAHAEKWVKEIVTINQLFDERLSGLANKQILKHEQLSQGVISVTYEGGVKILINYNDQNFTLENITVEAQDFAVVSTSK